MKNDGKLLAIALLMAGVALLALKYAAPKNPTSQVAKPLSPKPVVGTTENPRARIEYETRMLVDPKTKQIPRDIRRLELDYAETLPEIDEGSTESFTWTHRGPWNVGGRTRALALDVSDPNEQTILAGGVSGGMWRSTNGGTSWTRVTNPLQLQSVTCIAQDTRTGRTNTWYYGTGEFLGNSASGGDAFFKGDGIFKSTDGGLTWTQLASTVSGTPQTFDLVTDFIYNIAIDPSNSTQDEVYAACYGAVLRSTNGGASWSVVLNGLGNPNQAIATDVAVTSTGVVYATVSNNSSATRGIFRSTDGVNWTNITPSGFPSNYRRIVIGIAPSNENIVYFLGETPGGGKLTNPEENEWMSLWRYNAATNSWQNRSNNLPDTSTFGTPLGGFNSQGSYNLVVKVKPDNENFVIIGGTNLYRSTDGFSTANNIAWIGGYHPTEFLYPNHHPDQHAIVFYRNAARSNWMLSGCDAGVSRTTNIAASNVSWTRLSNGYLTTQFYTIAIQNASGDVKIIGGKQDNGTYRTVSSSSTANWQSILGGDGAYCAIAASGNPHYVSSQNGFTLRLTLDAAGNYDPTNWTRVDPQGGSGYLFINPFKLDPNNSNRMYFAGGTRLWRNDNLTGIPSLSNEPASFGWTSINLPISQTAISAIAVSTTPANRVYVGTATGDVLRIDNAQSASPTITNVTGASMPAEGYVSDIAIDPSNANNAMVVFSNYNVISLYYTTNGGTSWTAVAGNLEQNPDGTGNGPSCRCAAIRNVSGGKVFLVGTSTGLYVTSTLNGMSTVWQRQAPNSIGRAVVTAIATRESDGVVVAATHGNGVYSATVNSLVSAPKQTPKPKSFMLAQNYPNPFNPSTTIEYRLPSASDVTLEVFDALGRKVRTLVNERQGAGTHQVHFNAAGLASGTYFYKLRAGDNVETRKMLLVK
ncbi:MAG: T9SS type A sorting domain-containing protein [Chloroherpetonaceae bacterium]|nr:T9SS type A sorting domain-containing protein [Chloroherpetonaceae bacterium]MDW8437352.1 T9SS type A sorting domain-containing protein [Chloroherpetonaceae bacterium]